MVTAKLTAAAGYIRMSTAKQEDSPERQRREINALAKREGYRIVEWYADEGLTGTKSKNRPKFQELLVDAAAGKFGAVLIHEHSRFSREDVFDAMAHFKLLKDCGVKLVTSSRGEIRFDDLGGMIMTIVDQHGARSEAIKLAERGLSGKLAKADRGDRFGRAPFGYDREILNSKGEVIHRVHFQERFQAPPKSNSRLVPSADDAAVSGVSFAFEALTRGESLVSIATELNQRGLRTCNGNPFIPQQVKRLIENPVYAGVFRFGHTPTGEFARSEELILKEQNHPGIVSMGLFNCAQEMLKTICFTRASTKPGRYMLAGLVQCDHCGSKTCGFSATGDGKHRTWYRCSRVNNGVTNCDRKPLVSAPRLEGFILRTVAERVLTPENCERIIAVARQGQSRVEPGIEPTQIAELERRIARAEENMAIALADCPENYEAIARQIKAWRDDLKRLKGKQTRVVEKKLTEEEAAIVGNLSKVRAHLHKADRVLLATALRRLIDSIHIGRRKPQRRQRKMNRRDFYGVLTFHEHIGLPKIEFADVELYHDRKCYRIADFAKHEDRTVRLPELVDLLGVHKTTVIYHAKEAVERGLLAKVPGELAWHQIESN